MSSKEVKAYELIKKGVNIKILNETDFIAWCKNRVFCSTNR